VKENSLAQMKDEGSGIGLVPAHGECGREVEADVARNEAIEQKFVNVLRLRVGAHPRVEVGRARLDEEHYGAGIALGAAATGDEDEEESG
jgi:hypothetical protein